MDVDVVVMAGDVNLGTRGIRWMADRLSHARILYVPGNHEYWRHSFPDLVDKLRDKASKVSDNITVLDRDSVEIDGVVFLGTTLWTDFELDGDAPKAIAEARRGMGDYKEIWIDADSRPLAPSDSVAAHRRDVAWLRQALTQASGHEVVVVTHHAPSARSIPPYLAGDPLNPAYVSNLDELVHASGASLWVHGHTHYAVDYRIGSTRVISNPRGYTPVAISPGFEPDLVAEI